MRIIAGLLLMAFGVTAGAQAQGRKESLTLPTVTKGAPVQYPAELFLPVSGSGPFPAMVIHHGSGGVSNEREYAYAREFIAIGVAAIVMDSFTPRGVKSTVKDQNAVSALEFLSDAMAALKAAAAHPMLDPKRIGITGFSKGGTSSLYAALEGQARRFAPAGLRYALHVPFYPACVNQYRNVAGTGAPVLILMGAADSYVGTASCLELAERMRAVGVKVETTVYPGAGHGFDGGRPYTISDGENYSRCVYVEQADGGWIEKVSGVTTHGPGGKPIEGAGAKALAACRSYGVSGGMEPKAKAESLTALLNAVKSELKP